MKAIVISTSILLNSLFVTPVLAADENAVSSLEPIVNAARADIPTTLNEPTNAADTLMPVDVRVPEGDVETFWNQQEWEDMSSAEQALWAVLGWTEASWNEEQPAPASESKEWAELTEEEVTAAQQLSYTQELWDTDAIPLEDDK